MEVLIYIIALVFGVLQIIPVRSNYKLINYKPAAVTTTSPRLFLISFISSNTNAVFICNFIFISFPNRLRLPSFGESHGCKVNPWKFNE